MKKLVQSNIITLPNYQNYQEPQVKLPLYNKKDLLDFHKIKGHKISSCMKLKNSIQDLIGNGDVTMDQQIGNQDPKIYKNPMLDHSKGNDNGKGKDYHIIGHFYKNLVASCDQFISMLQEWWRCCHLCQLFNWLSTSCYGCWLYISRILRKLYWRKLVGVWWLLWVFL